MLTIALVVNIAIVAPLSVAMLRQAGGMDVVYGPNTDARRILACLYATIGVLSLVGLALLWVGEVEMAHALAFTLLPFQIVYKLMTWPCVGLSSPVVRTNLLVVVLHAATLLTLL